mmetsp:Transcript_11097/g.30661  ORF Transcript_11097/g.30661 Transcript_11097/m.30661 type:complete len:322 (-) Transcript_11097:107-1072(-)
MSSFLRLLLWKQNLLKVLPQHGEENSLQTVGKDLGLQSAEQETLHAALGDDVAHDLRVRYLFGIGLLVDLADADAVGAGVGDGRGAETEDGTTAELAELRVLLGDAFAEVVVGEEPWVMSDEGGGCGSETSVVQGERSGCLDLVHDDAEFSCDLHGRLDGIDWHQEDTKDGGRCGGRNGLDTNRKILGAFERIEQSEDTRVGRSVTKSRQWSLEKGWQDATVETRDTTICVKRAEGHWEGGSVAVLVVDGCSHPHETGDVGTHGDGTGRSSADGRFGCFLHHLAERQLRFFLLFRHLVVSLRLWCCCKWMSMYYIIQYNII